MLSKSQTVVIKRLDRCESADVVYHKYCIVRVSGKSREKHPDLAPRGLVLFEISCTPEASKLDSIG